MDWLQVFFIIFINSSLVIWASFDSEKRHKETRAFSEEILQSIRDDMRDFHKKLLEIEERNRK